MLPKLDGCFGRGNYGRRVKSSTVPSTEHEPQTGLLAHKYALSILTPKREGSTMAMLSARGVEVDAIDELIAAGLATATIERVGRRAIEITRVKITEAGRRALFELQYCGPAAGMIDSLDEAKATFEGVGAA